MAVVPVSGAPASSTTTAPAASCTSGVVQNGGFESGSLAPWTVTDTVGATSNKIVAPGSTNAGGGAYAFAGYLTTPSAGVASLTLQQTLSTCVGTNYSVSVDYKVDAAPAGACSVKIVYPYKTTTGSVSVGNAPVGAWGTLGGTFQAVSGADVFEVVTSCSVGGADVEVDNVQVAYYPYNAF